jgi:hypothetical protein
LSLQVNALTPWAVPKIAQSLGWLRNLFAATVLVDWRPYWGSAVRKLSRRQSWQRRVVAVAAAYVIALSSLLASFGAARAAAETTANPFSVICHHDLAGQSTPADDSNGNTCIDCCCVGCLMPMAALPAPPEIAAPVVVAVAYRFAARARAPLAGTRTARSHRSRAPPFDA